MVNLTFYLPRAIMINDYLSEAIFKSEEAHSSRGLGHLPLKEEITGSNPVCATKAKKTAYFVAKLSR